VSAVPEGFQPMRMGGEFIGLNGPLYVRHDDGMLRLGFRVEPRHTNPMGICHGGMMASFCDMLLPVAAHYQSTEVERRFLPTISLQLDYLSPVAVGAWVEGTAEVLRTTRSLVFAQGRVTADGVPAARVSGILKVGPVFARTKPPEEAG
jgi:uncharacterized protein (TIGR00369 family)